MTKLKCLQSTLAVIVAIAWTLPANAGLITKGFHWTGVSGYVASGTFTYDDTLATVTANGFGATNGLEELEVSFFDPASTLLASFDNVTAGVSSYEFLTISFDTASMEFFGAFDVGEDTLNAVADPEFYVLGDIGGNTQLVRVTGGARTFGVDTQSDTVVDVFDIPEPASIALLCLGLAGTGFHRRRKVA